MKLMQSYPDNLRHVNRPPNAGRTIARSLIEDAAALADRLMPKKCCSVCGHVDTADDPVRLREELPGYLRENLRSGIDALCENLGRCVSRRGPNGERDER